MRARLCALTLAAVAVLAAGCGTQQASTVTLSAAVANRGSYPDRRKGQRDRKCRSARPPTDRTGAFIPVHNGYVCGWPRRLDHAP